MKTAKDLRAEIIQANEALNSAFIAYIDAEDHNAQKSYKRIIEYQRKSIEELIKLYWSVRDEDEVKSEDSYTDGLTGSTWVKRI